MDDRINDLIWIFSVYDDLLKQFPKHPHFVFDKLLTQLVKIQKEQTELYNYYITRIPFPLLRQLFPSLIAGDLISVHPLSPPKNPFS